MRIWGSFYQYRLGWYFTSNNEIFHVNIEEAELRLPYANSIRPLVVWMSPRVVGQVKTADILQPLPGQYTVSFENTYTDVPNVVIGLPKIVDLTLVVDSERNPISAEAAGIKFECIKTKSE